MATIQYRSHNLYREHRRTYRGVLWTDVPQTGRRRWALSGLIRTASPRGGRTWRPAGFGRTASLVGGRTITLADAPALEVVATAGPRVTAAGFIRSASRSTVGLRTITSAGGRTASAASDGRTIEATGLLRSIHVG